MFTKLTLCVALSLLTAGGLLAQVQTIRGTVRDVDTEEPVPFVHLRITGTAYGTSTNLDGQFEIKLDLSAMREKDLSLTLSCIGYRSLRVPPNRLDVTNAFAIESNTTSLGSVTVTAQKTRKKLINQGRRIVLKALRRIPYNHESESVLYPSFYRHYCAENETYVRLIEAAIDVYRPGKKPYQVLYPEENLEFQVNQLRRSFDFTESARLSHPPISLNFLLNNDITSYTYKNPFFAKRTVNYALRDTTYLGNEQIAVVDFRAEKSAAHPERFDGTLYISLSDFAFVKSEVNERFTRKTISDSINLHNSRVTFYKKLGDRYFLDRTISDLDALHLSFDSLGVVTDSVVHRAHIELITNDVLLRPEKPIEGGEPTKEDLRNVAYDSLFWDEYTILEATNLEKQIIEDLSERLSLEKQFAMFNDIEMGGKSVLSSTEFKELIQQYAGRPTYVILWAGWAYPNYFDIEPGPYLARQIKRGKIHLLLVSLDHREEDWEEHRLIYQLDRKAIHHERIDFQFDSEIAKKYFRNVLPYRCVLDASGRLVEGTPPLPSDPTIQDFLRSISQNRDAEETGRSPGPGPENQN
ncbi:MAG: carboxypeptidase-like regulatory domain-containing protein [Bacteroidota bacterium]